MIIKISKNPFTRKNTFVKFLKWKNTVKFVKMTIAN